MSSYKNRIHVFVYIVLIFILGTHAQAQNFYKSQDKTSNLVRDFLNNTASILPEEITNTLPKGIAVHFKNLNDMNFQDKSLTEILQQTCKNSGAPNYIAGKRSIWGGTIYIDNKILAYLMSGQDLKLKIPCSHDTIQRFITAVLIHETAHEYDVKKQIKHDDKFMSPSSTSTFSRLISWSDKRQKVSIQSQRYFPDNYAKVSNFEAFASLFEFYILDENFFCRRPDLAHYFDQLFNQTSSTQCKAIDFIYLEDTGKKITLNGSTIRSVRIVYAQPGQELMSKWGHAQIELVVCENTQISNTECDQDLRNHLSIGYGPNISNLESNLFKFVFGGFGIRLYATTFFETLQNYRHNEIRDVWSYPLRISDSEKQTLAENLLVDYWSYEGDYFALSENCATNILLLLERSLNNADDLNILLPIVPKTLIENLIVIGRVTFEKSQVRIYPSILYDLNKSISLLTSAHIINGVSLEQLLTQSTAENRAAYAYRIRLLPEKERKVLMAALYIIENHIEGQLAHKEYNRIYNSAPHIRERMNELNKSSLRISAAAFNPQASSRTYGIPIAFEVFTDVDNALRETRQSSTQIKNYADQFISDELIQTRKNLKNYFF